MTSKGTVLEIKSDTALVMTSDCDFLEINRLEGMETGQEVVFSRRDVVPRGRQTGRRLTYALVACLALFFICIPVYTSFFTATAGAAVAYVSIDINPSLELAVNNKSRVLAAEAFDQDGEKLLQSVPVQGKPVTEAIAALIGAAEKMEYISNDGEDLVLVCLSPAEEGEQNPETLVNIGDKLADYEKSNTDKVKVVETTNTQYQEAKQMGMSAGRYTLWKDIGKSDQSKLEQYKTDKPANFLGQTRSSDNEKSNWFKPGNGNGNGTWNGNGNGNSSGSGFGFENSSGIWGWNGNGNVKDNKGKYNENENKKENGNGNSNNSNSIGSGIWSNNRGWNSSGSGSGSGFRSGTNGGIQVWNSNSNVKEKEKENENEDKDKNENGNGNWYNGSNGYGSWNNDWGFNSKTSNFKFQETDLETENKFNKNSFNKDFMNKDKNTNQNTDKNGGNAARR